MKPPHRVAIVGAGFISSTHIQALRSIATCSIVAVVDPAIDRAKALAARHDIPSAYESVDDLLKFGDCTVAHILTPPEGHASTARRLLDAKKHVFIEKPMCATSSDADDLLTLARARKVNLGVNHNSIYSPAFARLRDLLTQGRLGRLQHVIACLSMPLRQLSAGQHGHWMFRRPVNILLEQATHPLAQVRSLVGPVENVAARTGPALELKGGRSFHPTWTIDLRARNASAQFYFSVGREFPSWSLTAICSDGTVAADILADRLVVRQCSRWPAVMDDLTDGMRTAGSLAKQSVVAFIRNARGIASPATAGDTFGVSMRNSIAAFYSSCDDPRASDGPAIAAELIRLCEQVASHAECGEPVRGPGQLGGPTSAECRPRVTVIGGTGFIGSRVVRRLLQANYPVTIVSRTPQPDVTSVGNPQVCFLCGDVGDRGTLEAAIGGSRYVIDLAQGLGSDVHSSRDAATRSANLMAELCCVHQVERLIHVGSIAALYLGRRGERITGATPVDARIDRRSHYAGAKAAAESVLMRWHRDHGLRVCVLRPGLVVGEGGTPFHSGVGFFNNTRHCIGWHRGETPLPFVLVDDVAVAIEHALLAPGIDGCAYNLAGDVRFTARTYISELARAMGRPLEFHPQLTVRLYAVDALKYAIKRVIGRRAISPSWRDLRSRALLAAFDCGDAKADLNWTPVADRAVFIAQAIEIHRGRP